MHLLWLRDHWAGKLDPLFFRDYLFLGVGQLGDSQTCGGQGRQVLRKALWKVGT